MEIKADEAKYVYNGLRESNAEVERVRDKFQEMRDEVERSTRSMREQAEQAPRTARLQLLMGLLSRVEKMQGNMYSGRSWNRLMRAYGRGRSVSQQSDPDMRAVRRALNELKRAFNQLEPVDKDDKDDETREGLPIVVTIGNNGNGAGGGSSASDAVAGVTISIGAGAGGGGAVAAE